MSLPKDFKKKLEEKIREEAKKSMLEAKRKIEVQHQECEKKLELHAKSLVEEFTSSLKE